MLYSKFAVAFLSAIAVTPAAAESFTYDNVIALAAEKHRSTPGAIKSSLIASGNDPRLRRGMQGQLGWGGGSACPLDCEKCADCATAAGEASIASLAAWAAAVWACATGVLCPGAIASAAGATAVADATFCNSQHQSPGCNWDCGFWTEPCETLAVNPPKPTNIGAA